MNQTTLPPTVERLGRRLVRRIETKNDTTGLKETKFRDVSLDWAEAKLKRLDYYHPEFGWLVDGFKRVTDATLEQILADSSSSIAKRPD